AADRPSLPARDDAGESPASGAAPADAAARGPARAARARARDPDVVRLGGQERGRRSDSNRPRDADRRAAWVAGENRRKVTMTLSCRVFRVFVFRVFVTSALAASCASTVAA